MGLPPTPPAALAQHAALLRDSLHRSQSTTHHMVSRLSTFDHRLSALDEAIRPVVMKATSMRKAHENIGKTLSSADAILTRFDVFHQAENAILKGTHNGLEGLLTAIDLLRSNVEFFASNKGLKNREEMISHANSLLAKAVLKLEETFKLDLSSYSVGLDPEHIPEFFSKALETSSDPLDFADQSRASYYEREVNLEKSTSIPTKVLLRLQRLAQQLVQVRREMQCSNIYRDVRGPLLERSLQKLGMERLRNDSLQSMEWEALEAKIRNWIRVIRITVKWVFFVEKKFCNDIFKDINSLKEQCFAEMTSDSVQLLINFAEAVSDSKVMPEKMFALLDMYKTMQELRLDMEMMFEGKVCSPIQKSVLNLRRNLSQTIWKTLTSFENRISEESTKPPNDGRVHPMTSYVINYLRFLFDYLSVLKHISTELNAGNNSNYQLETMIARLIRALELNLDAKCRQYKDPALSHLFLMNNIHYIVTFVRGSEANVLLGKDWVDKHRRIVQQNAIQYRRTAWAQVAASLSTQGLGSTGSDYGGSSGASRDAVRERFKSFNMQFEELHEKHSQWVVRDQDLADNLRLSISEILVPAYRSFTDRFRPFIENTRNSDRYVKYTPDSIESMVGQLFRGGER